MANKSSMIITATDVVSGNPQQKTITDINPQASDAKLKTWAQMTASLTKDSYIKSKRVDVRELDSTKPALVSRAVYMQTPSDQIEITDGSVQYEWSLENAPGYGANNYFELRFTTPECGIAPVVTINDSSFEILGVSSSYQKLKTSDTYLNNRWVVKISFTAAVGNIQFNVTFPESADYAGYSVDADFSVAEDD